MKTTGAVTKVLSVLCILQVATAWRKFNDLRVKTNAFGLDNSEAFYEIPTSTSSPLFQDYTKAYPEPSFKLPLDFYCYANDPRVCFMYDRKGNVAGIQISVLKSDVAHVKAEHYDYEGNKNFVKTNFYNSPAYSYRVFFTNPEILTNEGRKSTEEVAEGLWAYLDGKLVEIQRQEPTGPKMGDFDRQGCYPAMGQHYFYKYNKDSICKDMFSLFPLYEQGGLVGFGVAAPTKGSKGSKDWYEVPNGEVMKAVITNPVNCKDITSNYEHRAIHVFLVDKPWEISCP